jgi:pimeloyl-ACP methyl ester carboxylesterase
MATFVLIHGAWHGNWNWDRLVPELEARGHVVVLGGYPQDRLGTTWETYAGTIVDSMRDLPDRPVVVGHSLGAAVAAVVAARTPVQLLIYLCPLTPFTDRPQGMPDPARPGAFDHVREEGGFDWWEPADAIEFMYGHLDPETAAWAAQRLLRSTEHGPYPLALAPSVPSTYIYTSDDEFFAPDSCRWMATHVVHVDPIELPGGHFPQLERPDELAELLSRLAVDTAAAG